MSINLKNPLNLEQNVVEAKVSFLLELNIDISADNLLIAKINNFRLDLDHY